MKKIRIDHFFVIIEIIIFLKNDDSRTAVSQLSLENWEFNVKNNENDV